jgi:hypothetical protein
MLWIIISILVAVVVAVIGYFVFFSKGSEQTVTMKPEVNPIRTFATTLVPTKLIGNLSDPAGIKNGNYKEVSNSKFFSSNANSWNISIKFNLDKFNKTLQSIIGNMQGNGWGLWITPERKLQWRIGATSWDLNNFGELKDSTLYQIDIRYNNNNYTFSLKNLDTDKLKENFYVIDVSNPMIISAGPITTNSGVITLGGDTNNKFTGSINDITSFEIVPVTTMAPTTTKSPTIQSSTITTRPPTIQSSTITTIAPTTQVPVTTIAPITQSSTTTSELSIPAPIVTNFRAPTGEYGSNCVPQNSSCNCRMLWKVLYQVTVNGVKSMSPPSAMIGISDNCNFYWNPTLYFTINNPPTDISSDIKLILLTQKAGENKWWYSKAAPLTITGNNNDIKFEGETATFGEEYTKVMDYYGPPTAKVIVYEHGDYGGRSLELDVGTYDYNFINGRGFNDQISSMKVPQGLQVEAWEHDPNQGRRWIFQRDTPWVGDANDTISSLIIRRI